MSDTPATNGGWWVTKVETVVPEGHSREPVVLWEVSWGMLKGGHQFRKPSKNMVIDMLEDIDMSTWPADWVIQVYRVELRPVERHVRTYQKPACFDTPTLLVGCNVAYTADYDKLAHDCPKGKIVAEDERRSMSDYQAPRPSQGWALPGGGVPPLPLHDAMTAPAWLVLWDYPFREHTGPDNPVGADWIWKSDHNLESITPAPSHHHRGSVA